MASLEADMGMSAAVTTPALAACSEPFSSHETGTRDGVLHCGARSAGTVSWHLRSSVLMRRQKGEAAEMGSEPSDSARLAPLH